MSESSGIFNQTFVYCGVCHRRSTLGDPLSLTSCAHILCSQHVLPSKVCPICQTNDISIILLTDSKPLPNDVRIFFEPMPQVLEQLYNVSQFQMNGWINQCKYYQSHCVKLREKCARQQQLLYQAKQELDAITTYKNKIKELENIIKRQNITRLEFQQSSRSLSTSSSLMGKHPPPPTVDLTLDDDEEHSLEAIEEASFLNKLKKTSSLWNSKTKVNNKANARGQRKKQSQILPSNNNNNHTSITIAAESTQLNRQGYSPTTNSVNSNISEIIHSLSSPSSSAHLSPGPSSISSNIPSSKLVPNSYSKTNGNNDNIINNINNNNTGMNNTSRAQFPNALEKLRIVRRNNTISSNPTRTISNSQGILTHMRSSEGISARNIGLSLIHI